MFLGLQEMQDNNQNHNEQVNVRCIFLFLQMCSSMFHSPFFLASSINDDGFLKTVELWLVNNLSKKY